MGISILEPIYTRQDDRGLFQEVIRGYTWQSVIVGHMHKGSEMGHHYHLETILFFYITNGTVAITTEHVKTGERKHLDLIESQGVLLETNQAHIIRFLRETNFLLLKSSSYNPENPDTYEYLVSY